MPSRGFVPEATVVADGGALPASASNGCWESYLQHALHDPSCVISDLVVGKGACTDDAFQHTSAAVSATAFSKVTFESIVKVMLLGLHVSPSSSYLVLRREWKTS